ncbi:2-oxoacid:acceptor oxidoreductase family protein [Actinomyces ruminicola]|uniref:Pyruvate ferredoxin oxidoreductase gamma subunit n=1 Tax=Actinomyces ruminicola TaxID=332524 RepID=A0A1G9UAC2_9ACTO|nr:2-oxoacid:acceptor oxidoreductase family protein [Actinomyces ruminicola]SDM56773.1 pyruvate ferredoxin oxidoreductase gamma subunit [Actinomyces ruminicola]
MFQIRIHGRGGQGVVTAADLLAYAAFKEDRYAQAFPSFGSERTGAPVVSYCRIDTSPIRTHEPVLTPDAVIVQDPTLLGAIDVFAGLRPGGYALINSSRPFATFDLDPDTVAAVPLEHRLTVPATELAMEHLGRPLPNAVLLGAFTAVTDVLGIEAVCAAIADRFPGTVGERNIAAARAAHQIVADKLACKLAESRTLTTHDHEEDAGAA